MYHMQIELKKLPKNLLISTLKTLSNQILADFISACNTVESVTSEL